MFRNDLSDQIVGEQPKTLTPNPSPGGIGEKENTAAVGHPYPDDQWSPVYAAAADEILKATGIKKGFCLVVGGEQGRLAYELAARSELNIYAVEPDASKVAAARKALAAARVYGSRVTVYHGDVADIPYSNYFANLIVSDTLLRAGSGRHLPDAGDGSTAGYAE